jgi:hypothetical protein
MLTIKDILARVDRSKGNSTDCNPEHLLPEFDIHDYFWDETGEFDRRIRGYWVVRWYCTDSWVGIRVYDIDGEPFAISTQTGRKMDENFEFVSVEMAAKVRGFIRDLMDGRDRRVSLLDLNKEFPETYRVAYGSQIIDKEGLYQGEPCTVTKTWDGWGKADMDRWGEVQIRLASGEEKVISTDDYLMPVRVRNTDSSTWKVIRDAILDVTGDDADRLIAEHDLKLFGSQPGSQPSDRPTLIYRNWVDTVEMVMVPYWDPANGEIYSITVRVREDTPES